MRFAFGDDARLFRESVREFLGKECTSEDVTALWRTETGRSPGRWAKLAQLGAIGILVPEAHGGMGLDERDLVLALEESGRAALPEPLVETAAVGAPLLRELGDPLASAWLPRVGSGGAIVTVGHPVNPCVCDAHVADLLLLARGEEIHAIPRAEVAVEAQPGVDESRRLFRVSWDASARSRVAEGARAAELLDAALDRGALGTAAQQLGVAQRLVDRAVAYARQREQFGRPIGSFQAVKHHLATVQVRIAFARPAVYRAAGSVALATTRRATDVSQAKLLADDAALLAAKTALQVHGAIGYTWEQDVHVWMKRAWSLSMAWGTAAWHRARVGDAIFSGALPVGPGGPDGVR